MGLAGRGWAGREIDSKEERVYCFFRGGRVAALWSGKWWRAGRAMELANNFDPISLRGPGPSLGPSPPLGTLHPRHSAPRTAGGIPTTGPAWARRAADSRPRRHRPAPPRGQSIGWLAASLMLGLSALIMSPSASASHRHALLHRPRHGRAPCTVVCVCFSRRSARAPAIVGPGAASRRALPASRRALSAAPGQAQRGGHCRSGRCGGLGRQGREGLEARDTRCCTPSRRTATRSPRRDRSARTW